MRDWRKLEADVVKLINKHYTVGRGGARIEFVVIHHNGGVLSVEDCWQTWQTRPASAHYQVEASGRIGQLVWDRDTAWHAGNAWANARSLGIEISNSGGAAQGWPIAPKALEEAAHLVAAIHVHYQLGRPVIGRTVRFHREFSQTYCPGQLAPGGRQHALFVERLIHWFDHMTGVVKAPPAPIPSTPKETSMNIADRIRSLVSPAKDFSVPELMALVDKATWENRVLLKALTESSGLDPEKIISDAIAKERNFK